MWRLVPVMLLVMPLACAAALAQPADAPAMLVEEAVVLADSSATVWINGLAVELAVSTGTVDHVTLNAAAAAARLGLSAVPADNKADLFIGGVQQRVGRHGGGWLAAGGRLQLQQLYWFPGTDVLPLAGTIGPFALPHDRVRVEWQAGSATPYALALIGNIDRAAYGVADLAGRPFLVGADVRMRRPLPLVTAALGADLAETLVGRFVGESWQEEIMLGIRRPVRRLELARPLVIGPLRLSAVAVRVGGPRDATMSLARGQQTPLDAEEDPETIQVRGRIIRRRRAARYIMLSRTQLEAHGCISLTVAKSARQFILECAGPEGGSPSAAGPPVAASVAVPVAAPAAGLIEAVLPQEPETALPLDAPLVVNIAGQPMRLALGDAGREGLRLNGRATARLRAAQRGWQGGDEVAMNQFLDALRQQSPGAQPGVLPMTGGVPVSTGVQAAQVAQKIYLLQQEVRLQSAGREVQAAATWLENERLGSIRDDNSAPFDGLVALATLPGSRFRLRLGANSDAGAAVLALPIADRSHDQGVMGVAALPGIDAWFIGLELGRGLDLPVVSMALGRDLERLHGGRLEGPVLRRRAADYRQRAFRQLVLATPLHIGPLRLDRLLVESAPGLPEWLNQRRYGTAQQPLPDIKGIAGLERELRLPPAVLRAAGCHELVIDKPGRAWTLRCGTLSAPPAP